ncbi:MAG: ABC transporter ATP-binding protein [Nocardioides sp.]|nr:ABC transporter ATP-binding protein [Nocardioides sp.]
MSGVVITGLHAGYGPTEVLHGIDLSVADGELAAVLGPSGCGKTTLLRVLAGHHRGSRGTVQVGDRVVDGEGRWVPPERRRVTVVPQEGALFPHLDVTANVSFGIRRTPDVVRRTAEMLDLVGMAAFAHRYPHELSGGQQQRVAVARALAPRPSVVLLDEPFSALDAHLREQVRSEVRELLRAEEATALLVTHDQEEALSLADTVAVLHDGRIVQQDSPQAVYERPDDRWTARFLGETVLLDVQDFDPEFSTAETQAGRLPVAEPREGARWVLLRPEQLILLPDPDGTATVDQVSFHGPHARVALTLSDGTPLTARGRYGALRPGARVRLDVDGVGWLLAD